MEKEKTYTITESQKSTIIQYLFEYQDLIARMSPVLKTKDFENYRLEINKAIENLQKLED